jgi:hypothetical protein
MGGACERDRPPRKLLPVDCGAGIGRVKAKLGRGNMVKAGKTAPAAPNPLTKLRRLTDARPLDEFASMMVLPQLWHSQDAS